jgi:hypothetical protein
MIEKIKNNPWKTGLLVLIIATIVYPLSFSIAISMLNIFVLIGIIWLAVKGFIKATTELRWNNIQKKDLAIAIIILMIILIFF